MTIRVTKADLRDIDRAIKALDRIADRHGETTDGDWHSDEFDALSSARSAIAQWEYELEVVADEERA